MRIKCFHSFDNHRSREPQIEERRRVKRGDKSAVGRQRSTMRQIVFVMLFGTGPQDSNKTQRLSVHVIKKQVLGTRNV